MLGLGWTEMLVIGVCALIFIGPKDLPVVMNRVGKIVGQVRRMGNEFQREINKSTGLDEVRNLRNSIAAPLKKTSEEIRREFNAMTPTGPKPSGIIKPADPQAESVVDEIHELAGMTPPAPAISPAPPAPVITPPPADATLAATNTEATAVTKPVKAAAAPTRPVIKTELPALDAVPAPAESQPINLDTPAKKPRVRKAPAKAEVLPTEPADSPAAPTPKARAPRKPKPAPTTQGGTE